FALYRRPILHLQIWASDEADLPEARKLGLGRAGAHQPAIHRGDFLRQLGPSPHGRLSNDLAVEQARTRRALRKNEHQGQRGTEGKSSAPHPSPAAGEVVTAAVLTMSPLVLSTMANNSLCSASGTLNFVIVSSKSLQNASHSLSVILRCFWDSSMERPV